MHGVRCRLQEAGIRDSGTTIRERLRDWRRVTTVLETAAGGRIENVQDEQPDEPDEPAAAIAAAVGLEPGVHRKCVFLGGGSGLPEEHKSVVPTAPLRLHDYYLSCHIGSSVYIWWWNGELQ